MIISFLFPFPWKECESEGLKEMVRERKSEREKRSQKITNHKE